MKKSIPELVIKKVQGEHAFGDLWLEMGTGGCRERKSV
jgi:hypothetical protein